MDLWKSKEKPVTVEDEVPITQWEAERKKEVSSVCWDQLRQGCDSLGCSGGVGEGRGRTVGRAGGLLGMEMVLGWQVQVGSCIWRGAAQQKPCCMSHFSAVRTFSWSQSAHL